MCWKIILTLTIYLQLSTCIIYHLNDTEYDRLPAMFVLDNYDRCLRMPNNRYCVATFDLHGEPDNQLANVLREYSKHYVKHFNHSYIERGVCILESCKKFIYERDINYQEDLNSILEACVNESIFNSYGLEAKLATIYTCDKSSSSDIDITDWVVAGCFAAIILMNVLGTFYHWILFLIGNKKAMNNEGSLLLCFSIYKSWLHLVAPTNDDPKIARLKGFHGIKAISTFMIVLPHVIWISDIFIDNPHDFEKNYELSFFKMLNNGLVIVQTFFVISGFLLIYNLEVYTEQRGVSWWLFPKVMFLRWWRLTPAYAALLAFTATWMRHIGSGPLWSMTINNSVASDCRKYWWSHIFYFNNYIPDDKFCALQTWYVAVDSQLFILGLLVYIATKSRGRNLVLAILLIIGVLSPALHIWLQDLDGVVMLTPDFQRAFKRPDTFNIIHKPGHNNLPCYVIGMATAYLVLHWQRNGTKITKNKMVLQLVWFVVPAIAGLCYAGHFLYADGERPSIPIRVAYGATHRVVLGLLVGYGMIGLVMKFDVLLRKMFEWHGWVVPSRLSYCVYLVHANVIHYIAASKTTLNHVSTFNILFNHLGVVFVSFILSWPLYLLLEAPFNKLMKIIFKMEQHETKHKDRQQNIS